MRCDSTIPMVQCTYLYPKKQIQTIQTTFQSFWVWLYVLHAICTLYALRTCSMKYADYKNALSFVVQRTINAMERFKIFILFICLLSLILLSLLLLVCFFSLTLFHFGISVIYVYYYLRFWCLH